MRASAPGGITAAIDLFGTETIETALALGVAPDRIVAIAAGPNPPGGARAVFGNDARPTQSLRSLLRSSAHEMTVPIAATVPDRADPRGRSVASRPSRSRQDRGHALAAHQPRLANVY